MFRKAAYAIKRQGKAALANWGVGARRTGSGPQRLFCYALSSF